MDLRITPHFSPSSGFIKQQIIRPKRVFSTDYTENMCFVDGSLQSLIKRKHFELDEEHMLFLDSTWTVFSGCGFLKNPSGDWVLPSFSFPFESEFRTYFNQELKSYGLNQKEHLRGFYFVFTNVGYTNYYHVLSELLPRLEFFMPFKGKVKLLLSESTPQFLLDALQILGISAADYVLMKHGTSYSADALLTIPWGMNFIPERFQFLKNQLMTSVTPSKRKRFYISRKNEKTRHILNENELEPIFNQHEIEIIEAQNLTLKAQIELFSQAEIIIGPHGAGLTNLLWMQKPKIVEIRPLGFENDCFKHLALVNGAKEISVQYAKSVDENQNLIVDIASLEKVLKMVM